MIVIVMLFNVVFPSVASAVTIPIVGDIASLLVGAALNFIRFLADIVEGVMQYFFIGGTNSFWIMYNTSALEETEQYFTDAGYTNGDDGFKILYDSLPSDVKSSELIEIPEDRISNWIDNFYNAISSETNLSYNIPVLLFTPDNIFSNRIAAFDINFIDPPRNSGGQETISYTLRETIANWYNALRTLALAGMLVVLVYVGIRMIISTSASDKAKYKNMLMDWLIAVCMLFFLHYIMLFVIRVTESITAMISSASGTGDTWISVEGSGHYIRTNLMGAVRFQAENNDLYVQAGYTVMYIMLVAYTLIFGFRYLKRVINVAFLTIISPLIVIMYPIDKIGDGKAQGFSIWIKEYIFPMSTIWTSLVVTGFHIHRHVAMGFLAMRAGLEPLLAHHIVDHLALEGIHRLEVDRFAGLAHLIHGIQRNVTQMLPLTLQESIDIHNEMGTLTGLLLHRKTRQLLQRVHHLAMTADQMLDVRIVIGNDLHHGAVIADAQLDIAFVIDDIQQALKIIGGDVGFIIELIHRFLVVILRHCSVLLTRGVVVQVVHRYRAYAVSEKDASPPSDIRRGRNDRYFFFRFLRCGCWR